MADIRLAQPADLSYLPNIEIQAATLFEPYGLGELFAQGISTVEELTPHQQAGRLWVAIADDKPVGFILVSVADNDAHISEIDVLPEYGRQGIGRALIEAACGWAKAHHHTRISLSTQTNIPWNAPFMPNLVLRYSPSPSGHPPIMPCASMKLSLSCLYRIGCLWCASWIKAAFDGINHSVARHRLHLPQ